MHAKQMLSKSFAPVFGYCLGSSHPGPHTHPTLRDPSTANQRPNLNSHNPICMPSGNFFWLFYLSWLGAGGRKMVKTKWQSRCRKNAKDCQPWPRGTFVYIWPHGSFSPPSLWLCTQKGYFLNDWEWVAGTMLDLQSGLLRAPCTLCLEHLSSQHLHLLQFSPTSLHKDFLWLTF